ncbi:MAG: 50S ribosomal protein L23 [Parcubacteria group bacterium]
MSIFNKIFKAGNKSGAKKKPRKALPAPALEKKAADRSAVIEKPALAQVLTKKMQKKEDIESYKCLLHPLITEKATDLAAQNKYVFIVPKSAEKIHVKEKIQNVYGVKPLKINFIAKTGKNTHQGRVEGKRKDFKKAIVTMSAHDKLEIYEGV